MTITISSILYVDWMNIAPITKVDHQTDGAEAWQNTFRVAIIGPLKPSRPAAATNVDIPQHAVAPFDSE
jgi:hypothetical protein